jgi:Ca-activated chloride channel homolog
MKINLNLKRIVCALALVCLMFVTLVFAQEPKNPTPQTTPPNGEDKRAIDISQDLVTMTVTVTDQYGRFVSGLKKKAFSVFENGEEQEIEFFSDEDAPVSVGIVFDVSGSMSGDKISKARDALGKFIQTSHPRDEYFLIGFNNRAQLLMDRTHDGNAVLDKLTLVKPRDNTALYDAVYLGTEKVTRGVHKKRAILLISDGQDNASRYTFSDVRRLLKESDVTVYSIGILNGGDFGSSDGIRGQSFLDELSSVTGGKAFYPNNEVEMNEIFERIAVELRNQYSIGYYPKDFVADGKYRKLKIKVNPPRGLPRLYVRSREGYYGVTTPK